MKKNEFVLRVDLTEMRDGDVFSVADLLRQVAIDLERRGMMNGCHEIPDISGPIGEPPATVGTYGFYRSEDIPSPEIGWVETCQCEICWGK